MHNINHKTNSTTNNLNQLAVKPFLRWAGGKQKLVKNLLDFVPNSSMYCKYYEPFMGGGSLFFALKPSDAVISDINDELMNCYKQVTRIPKAVSKKVQEYAQQDCPDYFKSTRSLCIKDLSLKERAARFIYLNKAAFNGIYRVNKKGVFNVPYGPSPSGIAIPSENKIYLASKILKKADIKTGDFEAILSTASKGDFVYIDPPYPPLRDTACFTHYSSDRFDWNQQLRVVKIFKELSDRGCLVMLSNSGQKRITKLYSDFFISRLNVIRWLGSNGDRFRVHEIVVTNYNPKHNRK